MATKLRITNLLSGLAAGLLWTAMLAAAPVPESEGTHARPAGKLKQVGIASWYGKEHQGRTMANGKPFDCRKLTAAAWNVPLGTVLRVVNLTNGNSVIVTVTDRGPHPRLSRVIDLSEAAAQVLDYIEKGLTPVFIFRVPTAQFESAPITAQLIEPAAGRFE